VTSEPVVFGNSQPVVLSLAPSGAIVSIPVPRGNEQSCENASSTGKPPRTPGSDAKSPNATRRGTAKQATKKKASVKKPSVQSPSQQSKAKDSPVDLGGCPLCDAPVIEQTKSYSCSRWKEGCKLTIWKNISVTSRRRNRSPKRLQIQIWRVVQRATRISRRPSGAQANGLITHQDSLPTDSYDSQPLR
jgi:hypothetical protein